MKRKALVAILLSTFCAIKIFSQPVNINATVQIDGFRHNWDCGSDGTGSDPDPRYMVWIGWNGANYTQATGGNQMGACSGLGIYGGDEIGCSYFNPGLFTAATFYNVPANQINVDMKSWEEDDCSSTCTSDGSCTFNSDDTRCGRLGIGDINFYLLPPCTNNLYVGDYLSGPFLSMTTRCSDNGGAGYGIDHLIINWSFATAPTITTQPTAAAQGGPDRTFCIGTGTSMTVAVNSWNGWSLGMHYQWQVNTLTTNPVPTTNCPVTGWTNIAGATSATYVPPQTPGTRLYRCLITSNCAADFTSQTTASECVRITYHPFAAPIVSSVCGQSIAPNTNYNFCTTQEPNANASINNSSFTWTVNPPAGVVINNPTLSCTDISFTNNGTYTVTLTYGDACGGPDASSTCTVDIAPAGCTTIYVDGNNGNDANFGYEATPVQTVHRAFQLITGTRKWIRIENGVYTEPKIIKLQDGIVVEGGWNNTSGIWTKNSGASTTINFTSSDTVIAANNSFKCGFLAQAVNNWTLQDLIVTTSNAAGNAADGRGRTNYGLLVQGCTGWLVSRTSITSGNGSAGIAGSGLGVNGSGGNVGANGNNGSCDGTEGNGVAGPTGPGVGIRKGGNGGSGGGGGTESGCSNGAGGGTGGAGGGGAAGDPTPGGGGTGNQDPGGTGGNASGSISTQDGATANGTIGAPSYVAGVPGVDYVFGAYFIPGGQANGGDGTGGGGGAGGGGGGSQCCFFCNDGGGNGAGAGGSGGEGGQGGAGGFGGGGSFAVYVNGTTGTFTECIFISGATASGGTGQTGGTGGNGANGGTGASTCTGEIGRGGNGSRGGNGGNGGRGRDGALGISSPAAINGVTSNPSTTIPNPTTLTIDYYENAKGCVNSEIKIARTSGGPWVLPGAASFENNIASGLTSFGVGSNNATIIFNAAGVYSLTTSGFPYSNDIRIVDGTRTLPVISVNPSVVCTGSPFSLSATAWGTEIGFEWIVFTDSATIPSNIVATSTLQIPTFTLSPSVLTTYKIRYRVKEQCCGWSAPVYSTVTVNPPVTSPTAPFGTTTFCIPGGATTFTTSATNATSYTWSITGAGNGVTGTGTTGNVTFDPTFSGTGQICVTANGCAGPTPSSCTTFSVNPAVGQPVAPIGITTRCQGAGLDTFVTFANNATSYIWTVTGTGNGAGGTTDTSTISWGAAFTGIAQVCVQAVGCGTSTQVCSNVNVIPSVGTPATPVGIDSLCQNSPNGIYISSASNASDYLWSITGTGNTITSNNDSVIVDWDPAFTGSSQICVSSVGCGPNQGPSCLNVTITPTVGLPSTPSGTAFRCIGPGTDPYSSTATNSSGLIWLLTPAAAGTIDGAGTVTWSPLFTGTAQVGVIANGCNGPSDTTFLAVIVTGPVGDPSIPSGTATRCQGIGSDIYTTSATNASSYMWNVTPAVAGSIAGTTSSETVNWDPTYSGTASVCVIAVGCNGNSVQECFNVTINPSPPTPTITVTGLTTFCDGGSAVLTSSSPTNNNWLPNNETTPSITVTQSGTYAVEVTNGFGCTSTSTNQSIVVFANTINPTVTYSDTVCAGIQFTIVAGGTGVTSYLWNTTDTTAIITPTINAQTAFSVTMTDNNGCTADSTFFIDVYPFPDAIDDNNTTHQDTAISTYVIFNDNMSGTLSVTSQGTLGTASVQGDSILYTPLPGMYGTDFFVYTLCSKNCPTQCDTARVTIVIDQVFPLMIPGGFSPNGDGTNDQWVIQGLENYPQNQLTVINRWGDIIYQAQPYSNNWDGTSNTGINITSGHVTDGTYFYVFIPTPGVDPIKGSLEIRRN